MTMNLKKWKRAAATGLAAVTAMLSLSGCGPKGKGKEYKIFVIGQTQGMQFWKDLEAGANDAAEELGYEVTYAASADITKVSEQGDLIDRAVSEKYDAICIAPDHATALNDKLSTAYEAGLQIFTIDADVTGFDKRRSYIGTKNASAGAIAAREASLLLLAEGSSARAAVVCHSQSAASAQERVSGFTEELNTQMQRNAQTSTATTQQQTQQQTETGENGEDTPATTAITPVKPIDYIADTQYCDGTVTDAHAKATDILTKHPEVKVLYATNERSTEGVCQAVKDAGKAGTVKVIGFNSNKTELEYLDSGVLTATMLQNPYNMGYFGVYYAGSYLSDMDEIAESDNKDRTPSIPPSVDTGAIYVTKDNVKNEDIQLLINPYIYDTDKEKDADK